MPRARKRFCSRDSSMTLLEGGIFMPQVIVNERAQAEQVIVG